MKAKVPTTYTEAYLVERLTYLDMLCLMVLHEKFHFGAERLRRFYDAICPMADRYMLYNGLVEPEFGKRDKQGRERMDLYALRMDLLRIGIDYEEISDITKNVLDRKGKYNK